MWTLKSHPSVKRTVFCVMGVLVSRTIFCGAQTMTFNGSGTAWNVASHWTPNNVPNAAGESAVIPSSLSSPFCNLDLSTSIDWLTIDNSSAIFYLNYYALTLLEEQGLTSSGQISANNGAATINGNINNTGTIFIWGGRVLYLNGPGITNQGTIVLNQDLSTGNTSLIFKADTSISGSGVLQLSNIGTNYVQGQANTYRLTNEAEHTIRGSGHLGNNAMGLTNEGLIEANQSNPLYADPTDAQTVYNSGVLQANGGTLQLAAGTYDNTGGLIQSLGGSTVEIAAGAIVSSGTLSSSGDGVIRMLNGSKVQDLMNQADLRVNNSSIAYIGGAINNLGTITLNPDLGGGNCVFVLAGDTIFSGGGVLQLSDIGTNYVQGQANTYRLTNEAEHTIRGSGHLGNNAMGLTNEGLIEANQSNSLYVDPTDAQIVYNSGILQANGGTLQLAAGTYDNTSGLIQALAGSMVEIAAGAVVRSGTLSSSGDGVIRMLNGSKVQNLINQGDLRVNNSSIAYVGGAINNLGTITLNPDLGGGNCVFVLASDTVLTGSGVLQLSDIGTNYVQGQANTYRLTNEAGHTIRGSGFLGYNAMGLTNEGLIEANQINSLYVDPTDAQIVYNSGVLQANGGTMQLAAGTYDNTSGLIQALAGSMVEIAAGAVIRSGTLSSSGDGVLRMLNGSKVQNLTSQADLCVNNNSIVYFEGAITNNNTITLNPDLGVGNCSLRITADTVLSGSGVLQLSDIGTNYVQGQVNTYRLTNEAGHTIRGSGYLGYNAMTVTNSGVIQADQPHPLYVDPTDGLTFYNNGTLGAFDGASLYLNYGTYENAGIVEALNEATVTLINGAPLSNYNPATDTLTGGTWRIIAEGATTTLNLGDKPVVVNNADITLSGANSVFTALNGLADNQGSFTVLDGRDFSTASDLYNSGVLHIGAGCTFTVNGDYQAIAGSETIVDGDFGIAVPSIVIGGALSGAGYVNCSVELEAGAILSPGSDIGTLTTEDIVLGDGGVYEYGISGMSSDRVFVDGNLFFGETAILNVRRCGGGLPEPGDYVLFEVSGSIDTLPAWTIDLPGEWMCDGVIVSGNCVVLSQLKVPGYIPGDIDGDGYVDEADLALFVEHWLEEGCNEENSYCDFCDIDADGMVNLRDFALFAYHWME